MGFCKSPLALLGKATHYFRAAQIVENAISVLVISSMKLLGNAELGSAVSFWSLYKCRQNLG